VSERLSAKVVHLVSMSGGKDSTATALYALETQPRESIQFVFADTGNEHEATYEYLAYLESSLGIHIERLRRDLTPEWEHRRQWLMSEAPRKGQKNRPPRTEAQISRVMSVFDKGPTGNPYLDMCIIKGRFPSRMAQFCTQWLKTEPLTEYAMDIIDHGADVWSWQGVRRDESFSRSRALEFEEVGGGLWIYRPIVRWNALDTFDAMHAYGIEPNPLYKLGMGRVGCMPCINAGKDEIAEIAQRFPEHIDRIREWEAIVGEASWRQESSFFPSPDDNRRDMMGRGIDDVVAWSRTSRGGRQPDMFRDAPRPACSSSYGLCEGTA
jgi:3'-phosphoadenosine 5'-phosphosulfate sulfotransferase (PAPS reductase)/FAD synthetase